MASKTIATILNLKDNFSETIKKTTSNTAAFAKEVKQAESSITKLKSGVTGAFSSTGAKIAGLVGGLGIAEFARESLMLASDLNEVQNVVDTTFRDSANKINDFAKTTATQFGISELQAKKFSGTLGAMLKSAGFSGNELTDMSTSLTGLTGDLASFYNLDPEEAFDKIKSGISGMTEPLRSLGVDVSETTVSTYAMANGFNKQWKDATQAEKELWRYKSIMAQTKDAQGDYNKTSDSFANALRTLKLNFQTLGASIMSYAIPSFQDLFAKANEFITKIDIKSFMDTFIQALSNIKPYFDNFIGALENLAKTIWDSVQPAIDWIKKNVIPDGWDSVSNAINDVLTKATDTVNFINDNWSTIEPIILDIVFALGAYKLALMAIVTWNSIVGAASVIYETVSLAIWGVANATSVWEAAQWLLNVAMDANPIGFVIGLIAAIGYAIYEVIKHWQDICTWVSNTWDALKNNPIAEFIIACNPFTELLFEIAKHWSEITDAISKAWHWLTDWNNTDAENKDLNVTEHRQTTTDGAAVTVTSQGGSSDNGDFGTNATGTQYWKGGRTTTSENGDEIIDLPSGSRVYTANQSKKMLSGNGGISVQVNIQGNVIGNEEYADFIGDHIMNKLRVAFINQ